MLTTAQIETYRAHTFRLSEERRLRTRRDAVSFVDERGFVSFWPIKEMILPSLWAAVAGERPVADAHDDPGHVTWGWKDELLGKRQWYYAKVLRGKATMISLDIAPLFYALSENYGEPETDYLQLYEDGLMTREAKVIYETLLQAGPLDTVHLRRMTQIEERDEQRALALDDLQAAIEADPTDVRVGAGIIEWRYLEWRRAHRQRRSQNVEDLDRRRALRKQVTVAAPKQCNGGRRRLSGDRRAAIPDVPHQLLDIALGPPAPEQRQEDGGSDAARVLHHRGQLDRHLLRGFLLQRNSAPATDRPRDDQVSR